MLLAPEMHANTARHAAEYNLMDFITTRGGKRSRYPRITRLASRQFKIPIKISKGYLGVLFQDDTKSSDFSDCKF